MNRKGLGHKGESKATSDRENRTKPTNARVQHRLDDVRCVRQVQVTCKRVPRERPRRSTSVHNK